MNINLKNAFTMAEIMVVMIVISIISVITISSAFNMDKAKEKKLITQSHTIYSSADVAYREIVSKNTTSGNITSLVDANGDRRVDTDDMKAYLIKYMDGEDSNCNDLYIEDSTLRAKYINSNLRCFSIMGDVVVGVEYDNNCSLDAQAKEYLIKGDNSFRIVDRVCTRIIYEPLKSRGLMGHDLFIMAFGKLSVK